MWRKCNKLRRKLHKELRKCEKQLINLYENEPPKIYTQPDDWTDACQLRQEWLWEYEPLCDTIYNIRCILGLKRMSAREWYHNYLKNKKK